MGVLNFQMLPGSFCGKCHHSNDVTALVLKETKESGEHWQKEVVEEEQKLEVVAERLREAVEVQQLEVMEGQQREAVAEQALKRVVVVLVVLEEEVRVMTKTSWEPMV